MLVRMCCQHNLVIWIWDPIVGKREQIALQLKTLLILPNLIKGIKAGLSILKQLKAIACERKIMWKYNVNFTRTRNVECWISAKSQKEWIAQFPTVAKRLLCNKFFLPKNPNDPFFFSLLISLITSEAISIHPS